jgi:UDP-N-acetylmuramoylalanine--D-glutamate ligase
MVDRSFLSGRRAVVMGLGRFGGGLGVTRWLAQRGAKILLTDLEPEDKLADSLAKLKDLIDRGVVTLRLGGHDVSDFTQADLVVANPAVPKPWDNKFLKAAEAAGVPVTTEISLAVTELGPEAWARTIAITGTVGKSTTTAMIHAALSKVLGPRGDVRLGGNIGVSLLESPPAGQQTRTVLELSSFQLYWLGRTLALAGGEGRGAFRPRVGVVTNIAPNHLDWHGEMDHYIESKRELIAHQRPDDTAVLGRSVETWKTPARVVKYEDTPWTGPLSVPGRHNRLNAAAALAACCALEPGASPSDFAAAIAGFPGLEHRLQLVATRRVGPGEPARFYNDSKSTTPEATLTAVEALAEEPWGRGHAGIHLIAGGYDKGSDLSGVAALSTRIGGLYTIGATGPTLAALAHERGGGGCTHACGNVEGAFEAARGRLRPGDCLLLSPGCASWDQFVNYEARGELFVRLARAGGEERS